MIWLKLAFAGIWGYVWHWGTGVALIILCLGAAYFASYLSGVPILGTLVNRFRKDLIWVAVGVAVFMGGMYVGSEDAKNRCVAKTVVITNTVEKIVRDTEPKPEVEKTDKKGQKIKRKAPKDRWDNPEN